jgi:polyferredoxin
MKTTGKPPGLIRYDSEKGIREGHTTVWNARNRAYSVVLFIILSFFIYSLVSRPIIETTILRTPGLLYQENENNTISNVYNIKVVNKTHEEFPLELKILSHNGEIKMAGNSMVIKDQDMFQSTFLLFIPKEELTSDKTEVEFGIFGNGELLETYKATFIGP